MRAGRAIRDQRRDEAYWRQLCACGHRMAQHRNHQPSRAIGGATLIETPHPDYHPLAFKCDDCECVWRAP